MHGGEPTQVNRDHPRWYKSAYVQFDLTVNKYGWHDPQARMPVLEEDVGPTLTNERLAEPLFFRANSGDCIQFQATNLIPSVLNLDDFQVYTPTDTIGQHIHLVKFDVTSSDGSANGWNYEDGTFAADEVRERIHAYNNYLGLEHKQQWLKPATHPLFKSVVGSSGQVKGALLKFAEHNQTAAHLLQNGICPDNYSAEDWDKHPWCGAQSTVQRWWADPVLNAAWQDRTMRAVFTHDHYGPSSHQQHGFYAALVVEPKNAVWTQLGASPETLGGSAGEQLAHNCSAASTAIGTKALGGGANGRPVICANRSDGGPTSYAANIGYATAEKNQADIENVRREYNLAFADFAILYNRDLRPVNPPSRQADLMLPHVVRDGLKPKPEGISTEDPGTRLLNYRNEPIPLRVAEEDENSLEYHQKTLSTEGNGEGDLANVFDSKLHVDTAKPYSASSRFAKLELLTPQEIVDRSELKQLLQRQKVNTDKFTSLLQKNEPWRMPGDPSTPLLAAYTGDPLQLHLIQGAQEEQHVFSMQGMKWLAEPAAKNSGYMNGQALGISEHFEFNTPLPSAATSITDYWYGSLAVENQWDGMWGLLRSYGVTDEQTDLSLAKLARLPAVQAPPFAAGGSATCPDFLETSKQFFVGAWLASDLLKTPTLQGQLVYNQRFGITDPNAIILVNQGMANSNKSPEEIIKILQNRYANKKIEPLILRVNAGDCINIKFINYLPETMAGRDGAQVAQSWSYNLMPPIVNGFNFNQLQASSQLNLQPQLINYDVRSTGGGNNIGFNNCQTPIIDKATGSLKCTDFKSALAKPCKLADGTFKDCQSSQFEWYAGDVKFAKHRLPPPFSGAITLEVEKTISEEERINTDFFVQKFEDDSKSNKSFWAHYTPIEFGAVSLLNFGDVIKHSSHGAVAALIVEPRSASWSQDESQASAAHARIEMPNPKQSFEEFVLLVQDDLSLQQRGQALPNHRMADDAEDTGQKGFNYATEPLWARNGVGSAGADFNELNRINYTNTLSSITNIAPCLPSCEPETPIFEAFAGANVRFRILHPGGHSRQHSFVLHGHNWDYQPWHKNSTELLADPEMAIDSSKPLTARIGAVGGIGPGRHLNILTTAGGKCALPGDYLFRVQEQFQFQGGLWGIFRVNPTPEGAIC